MRCSHLAVGSSKKQKRLKTTSIKLLVWWEDMWQLKAADSPEAWKYLSHTDVPFKLISTFLRLRHLASFYLYFHQTNHPHCTHQQCKKCTKLIQQPLRLRRRLDVWPLYNPNVPGSTVFAFLYTPQYDSWANVSGPLISWDWQAQGLPSILKMKKFKGFDVFSSPLIFTGAKSGFNNEKNTSASSIHM